jgi:Do/DeqQ family serine protease
VNRIVKKVLQILLVGSMVVVLSLGICGVVQSAHGDASSRETPVVLAVRQAGPAVVNVSSRQTVADPFHRFGRDPFFDRFFEDFFPFPRREYTSESLGSGVVIDATKKLVLTNEHVIAGATEIKITLGDEKAEIPAHVVGSDPDSDLAVLELETDRDLPSLHMGDSSDIMIGETVIAIGNPFGLTHTVTTGVVSAVSRTVRKGERVYRDFIQTDASINPGNSGGPLLNINGDLIGINTAIYGDAEGIGFAIPINKAKRIVKDLIEYGEVKPVWLGLTLQPLDERLAQYFNLPPGTGVLVTDVDPESPAAEAGLARGDVVLSMDAVPLTSVEDYEDLLRGHEAGVELTLEIHREDKSSKIEVEIASFPEGKAEEIAWDRYGLEVTDPKGERGYVVVSKVRPRSVSAEIGIRPGDLISRINEIETATKQDFLKAMARYRLRQGIGAIVHRGRTAYRVTLAP